MAQRLSGEGLLVLVSSVNLNLLYRLTLIGYTKAHLDGLRLGRLLHLKEEELNSQAHSSPMLDQISNSTVVCRLPERDNHDPMEEQERTTEIGNETRTVSMLAKRFATLGSILVLGRYGGHNEKHDAREIGFSESRQVEATCSLRDIDDPFYARRFDIVLGSNLPQHDCHYWNSHRWKLSN